MPSDLRVFFQQFRQNYHTTGSIIPSSRWLGAALARYVPGNGRPRRVLEVGPGTGAVTNRIVAALGPQDTLDLVELNDRFVEHLRWRLAHDPQFTPVADRCRVIHAPVNQLEGQGVYDVIVSGLPLNNFTVDDVRQILTALFRLLAPQGTLSFFEYIAIRPARAAVSGREDRQRLQGIGRLLGELFQKCEIRRDGVWANFPPAWVHHLRSCDSTTIKAPPEA